jgi:multicomponent Na+:H+ antiporter subunit B
MYLGVGYRLWRQLMRSRVLDLAEALGTGGFAVAGLAPMTVGAAFLTNLLPLGETGSWYRRGWCR